MSRAVWITGTAAWGRRGERYGEPKHDSAECAFDGGHPVASIRARRLTAAGSNCRMRKAARPRAWELRRAESREPDPIMTSLDRFRCLPMSPLDAKRTWLTLPTIPAPKLVRLPNRSEPGNFGSETPSSKLSGHRRSGPQA
jgi:hypothetical protein